MLRYLWIAAIFVAAACWTGCGDDKSTGSSNGGGVSYIYSEIVFIDSDKPRLVKRDLPGDLDKIPEPLVNWEKSLGEPFTDNNGNGVYDPESDTYQDMNGNDRYDGPDDPWSEGIPFDDINGDGRFKPDPGNHTSGYEIGLPYADYNENAKHDGDLKAAYCVIRWQSENYYTGGTAYWPEKDTAAIYRFVSDSGFSYDLSFGYDPIMELLIVTDTGVYYRIYPHTILLLAPGEIQEEDSVLIELPWYPNPLIYHRSVSLGERLVVDNRTFSNLVKVVVGNDDLRHGFYFSPEVGLLAYEFWQDTSTPPENWVTHRISREYYFKLYDVDHSLVFPTRR